VLFAVLTVGAISAAPAFAAPMFTPPPPPRPTDVPCVKVMPSDFQNQQGTQPLQVCASLDKTSYRSSEVLHAKVTVTNLGTGPAEGVYVSADSSASFRQIGGFPDTSLFAPNGVGELAAGATVTGELDGYAAHPASGFVVFSAAAFEGQPNQNSNAPSPVVTATITPVTGDYNGVVFIDTNGNGRPDPGEGLAGVTLTLTGPFSGIDGQSVTNFAQTTDAQGQFHFAGLPGGIYSIGGTVTGGWVVLPPSPADQITVDGSSGWTNAALLAVRPLSESLHAHISFDQPSYHVGDVANMTVTLSNTGTTALTGIEASCDNAGMPQFLTGGTPAWGALAGDGVTLSAGQTLTLHIGQTVPADAIIPLGIGAPVNVNIGCIFGPNLSYPRSDYPTAGALADVLPSTTPTVDFTVKLIEPAGLPPRYTTIFLMVPSRQDPISWDSAKFIGIPQGIYDIVLAGELQLAPGQSPILDTSKIGPNHEVDVNVVPGTSPWPIGPGGTTPKPPSGGSTTPTPQSGGTTPTTSTTPSTSAAKPDVLAATGVDVRWSGLAASALITVGAVAVLATRRRRAG
jgi:hypothetical protein